MKLLKNKRGIALFTAIVFAVIVSVVLIGLYSILTSVFRGTEERRSFVTVREASSSGVRYGASMASVSTDLTETDPCRTFNMEFRIAGRDGLGITEVTVCRISVSMPGQEISGTSREPVTGSVQGTGIFKITSISRFPANAPLQISRVEAVYIR